MWEHLETISNKMTAFGRKLHDIQSSDFEEISTIMLRVAFLNAVSSHRGLDMRHISRNSKSQISFGSTGGDERSIELGEGQYQFMTLAHLFPILSQLRQDAFDYLTLFDTPNREFGMLLNEKHSGWKTNLEDFQAKFASMYGLSDETAHLVNSFKTSILNEASQGDPHSIPLGAFTLVRPDMPYLDDLITYDSLRIVTFPNGLAASLCQENLFLPFWWNPVDGGTVWHHGAKLAYALDLLLSCIWRDFVIVRQKAYTERKQKPRSVKNQRNYGNQVLMLPRTIPMVMWSPEENREIIERGLHGVRGHYRRLDNEQSISERAVENAHAFGYPPPPDGYTFVIPHTRGKGDGVATVSRRVVCQGLLTAYTAFEIIQGAI